MIKPTQNIHKNIIVDLIDIFQCAECGKKFVKDNKVNRYLSKKLPVRMSLAKTCGHKCSSQYIRNRRILK